MQFTTVLSAVLLAITVSAAPTKRDVPANLIVPFGINPGTGPDGTGNCVGVNGILIPCSCPPDLASYTASLNANVAAGHDVNNPSIAAPFPTDGALESQIVRLQTQISTLQNLHGAGVGCPAASTTWNAQLAALIAQQ